MCGTLCRGPLATGLTSLICFATETGEGGAEEVGADEGRRRALGQMERGAYLGPQPEPLCTEETCSVSHHLQVC